jgi:hypothetical protein
MANQGSPSSMSLCQPTSAKSRKPRSARRRARPAASTPHRRDSTAWSASGGQREVLERRGGEHGVRPGGAGRAAALSAALIQNAPNND